MIWVGIDTGTHTGLAVWEGGHFTELVTVPLHRALERVAQLAAQHPGDVRVVFEDARQRKWIPRERSFSQMKGRAMGAGAVKRDAAIWQEFLEDKGIPFDAVPPRKGLTKWSADTFAAVTGYRGRTSDHARDAALLVFGRCEVINTLR